MSTTGGKFSVSVKIDPEACDRTPQAIRYALQRKPAWLTAFTRDWMSASTSIDQTALDAVVDKFHPMALACATPGYLDEREAEVARIAAGDTAGMELVDENGVVSPWDASDPGKVA